MIKRIYDNISQPIIAVTPKGVEHASAIWRKSIERCPILAVTPKGVEHNDCIKVTETIDTDISSDAERR